MPQSFAPEQMVLCQELLANIIEKQSPTVEVLVKVSAFAADERSCKFIQVISVACYTFLVLLRLYCSYPIFFF